MCSPELNLDLIHDPLLPSFGLLFLLRVNLTLVDPVQETKHRGVVCWGRRGCDRLCSPDWYLPIRVAESTARKIRWRKRRPRGEAGLRSSSILLAPPSLRSKLSAQSLRLVLFLFLAILLRRESLHVGQLCASKFAFQLTLPASTQP